MSRADTRIERLLNHSKKRDPSTSIPFCAWTHFPNVDMDPVKLAKATFDFYQKTNIDLIKTMPNGCFAVEDWGCTIDYSEVAQAGVARIVDYAVKEISDWEKIKPLDIQAGAWGRELQSIHHLNQLVDGEVPIIVTIFSPLTVAYKLVGDALFEHIRQSPYTIKQALDIIADTTIAFAREAINLGCSGVFLATQMATQNQTTLAQYREYGARFDKKILHTLGHDAWLNIVHIHGENIHFEIFTDYPVQGISWHVWETLPDIQTFLANVPDKIIMGGLQRFSITHGKTSDIDDDIDRALQQSGGNRLILAPGCVIRPPFNQETITRIHARLERSRHVEPVKEIA